jgi:hypothetical protein
MAMAMVIWAVAAEVIIMDGAEDVAITMAGHAVAIGTTTKFPNRRPFSGGLQRGSATDLDDLKTEGVRDAWAVRIYARGCRYSRRLFCRIALVDQSARSLAA